MLGRSSRLTPRASQACHRNSRTSGSSRLIASSRRWVYRDRLGQTLRFDSRTTGRSPVAVSVSGRTTCRHRGSRRLRERDKARAAGRAFARAHQNQDRDACTGLRHKRRPMEISRVPSTGPLGGSISRPPRSVVKRLIHPWNSRIPPFACGRPPPPNPSRRSGSDPFIGRKPS